VIAAALLLAATLAYESRVTMYDVPRKEMPTEIASNGRELWFVSWHTKPKLQAYLGRITTRGRIRTWRVPAGHMPGLTTLAPDGTLWLSDAARPVFWRIDPKGRIGTVPGASMTIGIAYGPDGHLWCTHQSSAISRFALDGSPQGYWNLPFDQPMTSSLPPPPGPEATWIVAGSDGALWFLDAYQRDVGRITTTGEITTFDAPGIVQFSEIIAGPDGALWYAIHDQALGRISTSGETTRVTIGMHPGQLAADSKGRIWYGEGSRAGFVDRDGSVHEFDVRGAKSIRSLAEGPDGAMWFADQGAFAIGRIELRTPAPRRP
jgi:virginiamycin B lyase